MYQPPANLSIAGLPLRTAGRRPPPVPQYGPVPRAIACRTFSALNRNVILLLLLAAATARVPTTQPPRAALKAATACLALTRGDVQFALGRAVARAEEENTAGASTCDYAAGRARVTVTLQHLDRDLDLPAEIAALEREIEGSAARPAPAIGPRAFFLDIAGAGTQLHVIRGRDYLLVSVLGFGEGPLVSAAAEKMARAALARLQADSTFAPEGEAVR